MDAVQVSKRGNAIRCIQCMCLATRLSAHNTRQSQMPRRCECGLGEPRTRAIPRDTQGRCMVVTWTSCSSGCLWVRRWKCCFSADLSWSQLSLRSSAAFGRFALSTQQHPSHGMPEVHVRLCFCSRSLGKHHQQAAMVA